MAITNLGTLLKNMDPVLSDKTYCFCSFNNPDPALLKKSLGCFIEKEGVTLILEERLVPKDPGMRVSKPHAFITLNVYSDLEAVGFLAVISKKLAEAGISINAISAYYHDHVFVPKPMAENAMKILKEIQKSA